VPKDIEPSTQWGFDGQFYGELALDPLLRDPQLQTALDNPTYRARRILMPWLAWLGGLGNPFWTLNVYVALNPIFWVGFALLMGFLFRPFGWAGLAGFAAMLMTCGIIESMQCSLTDFPGFVLLTLACVVGGTGGAGLLALATLAREPNIMGLAALWEYRPPWLRTARRNMVLGLIAGVPIALWAVYVMSRFAPSAEEVAGGNLAWPMVGIMAKLGEFSVSAVNGDIHWREWYTEFYASKALHALLTVVSILTQCLFLLLHREWQNRLWRVGAVFSLYFLCISFISWTDHFTITRHALPINLAFNLVLAMRARRGWLVWFVLGNCFVPYGIYQFTIKELVNSVPPIEYRVEDAPRATPFVRVRFDQGWADLEWSRRHTWRWSIARHATVVLSNPSNHPVNVSLSCLTRSIAVRDLTISVHGNEVWSAPALRSNQAAATKPFLVPPGETVVSFDTSAEPVPSDDANDPRRLAFTVQDIRLSLSAPPPSG
jgi:hypothetical protein